MKNDGWQWGSPALSNLISVCLTALPTDQTGGISQSRAGEHDFSVELQPVTVYVNFSTLKGI